jgi:hypothetical protein
LAPESDSTGNSRMRSNSRSETKGSKRFIAHSMEKGA